MTCLECEKELSYLDHRRSMESFQAELCPKHRQRMERLLAQTGVPVEAVMLYYALRQEGIRPMLAWWDGKKTVDLAISRVKLNIEVDPGGETLTPDQAIQELEETMNSFKSGFTTLRIPHFLIRNHLSQSVGYIMGIVEGLRENIRVV